MASIHSYLNFNGNCEEAFLFYQSVFGGEFAYLGRFKDMPSEQPIPDEMKEKIMHVSLPISKETTLMGSDVMEGMGSKFEMGNNFSLSLNTGSEEEAQRLFNALSAEGIVTMPLQKTFWGALFGMLVDKFGINWMVNYDYEQK